MNKKSKQEHGHGHVSKMRSVSYQFQARGWTPDTQGHSCKGFRESDMEKVLGKALVDGTVHQFDCGRGYHVWFYGAPGAELRALRDRLVKDFDLEPWVL